MLKRTIALALAALLGAAGPADAKTVTITNDYGGATRLYQQRAIALARDGIKVRLAGICASACTIYLWRQFQLEVCALPGAQLLFHKPFFLDEAGQPRIGPEWSVEADREWSEEDMRQLPAVITRLLARVHVPSVAAGDSEWATVAIKAVDVLRPCVLRR